MKKGASNLEKVTFIQKGKRLRVGSKEHRKASGKKERKPCLFITIKTCRYYFKIKLMYSFSSALVKSHYFQLKGICLSSLKRLSDTSHCFGRKGLLQRKSFVSQWQRTSWEPSQCPAVLLLTSSNIAHSQQWWTCPHRLSIQRHTYWCPGVWGNSLVTQTVKNPPAMQET